MHLFYTPQIINNEVVLSEDEFKHAVRVLRLQIGDELLSTDGQGNLYSSRMRSVQKNEAFATIESIEAKPKSQYAQIAVAPTKNSDRIEWFVEKAVEIGISDIFLIACKHGEKKKINEERLAKKALSAMKQSMQTYLPQIHSLQRFESFIKDPFHQSSRKFIAYVDFSNPKHLFHEAKSGEMSLVLIGPEGDFSKEELELAIQSGFEKVSLGENRLRTETAALVACHLIQLKNS